MFGGFGITELLVILAIVVMLFGTKKLRTLGGDLGAAIKGFRNAMSPEEEKESLEDKREGPVVTEITQESTETQQTRTK